jgi:hypothetical protein
MSVALVESYAASFEPEDKRPAVEWGAQFVRPPQSARSSAFDVAATPWLREPINLVPDNNCKEIVCMMPTGAGKTTIFDVIVPRSIKTDPGGFLLTLQNDEEADSYWDERLVPIMESIPDINDMLKMLPRNKKRRGFIAFPHMSLYCSSLKWKAIQRKSVRMVGIDEAWLAPHGFIAEARARTHDRWNQRVILTSQGGVRFIEKDGEIILSELEEAWSRTDRREFSMVCPECGHVSPWSHKNLFFEKAETAAGEIDERAVAQSARYKCPGECGTEFPDKIDVRRQLSLGSIYVSTNDLALPGHIGFHVHGSALYYVPWGERALRWRRAQVAKRQGNLEPLRILIQKDFAEFWEEQEHKFAGLSSDAPPSDYVIQENPDKHPGLKSGFPWEIEERRFIAADYQELDGKYFVAVAAAFAKNGESRVIHAARINSAEELFEKQEYLGVPRRCVGVDCADNTPDVNLFCQKYGWLELLGSDRDKWPHKFGLQVVYFPWSVPEKIGGMRAACWRASWSNNYFHDLHAQKLAHGGLSYGVPADIEDTAAYLDPATQKPTGFWLQMRANHKTPRTNKVTGARVSQWVRIGKRPDHYRDARCMLLVMAGIGGCLGYLPKDTSAATTEPPPDD